METLGVSEFLYHRDIYDRMNTFSFDLDFYRKWCRHSPGPILELCCGTGRLTIPLKTSGLDIMGLDCSDSMLDTARRKAAAEGVDLELVKADMRTFDLQRRFSTIFIPFNSLQNTYSVADLELVFANVKAHLSPGGVFLFDVFNPSIRFMVERENERKEALRFHLDDGREIVVMERCRYDAASQVNRAVWYFTINNVEREERLDMRCFFPLEMDALLKYNGFAIVKKFGSFEEAPFESGSQKQIYVCAPVKPSAS